jgi:hypothetical protein
MLHDISAAYILTVFINCECGFLEAPMNAVFRTLVHNFQRRTGMLRQSETDGVGSHLPLDIQHASAFFGGYLTITIFSMLVSLFFIIALISQTNQVNLEMDPKSIASSSTNIHKAHSGTNTTQLQPVSDTTKLDRATDTSKPEQNMFSLFWLTLFFVCCTWICIVRVVRIIRARLIPPRPTNIQRSAIDDSFASLIVALSRRHQGERPRSVDMRNVSMRLLLQSLQRNFTSDDYDMLQMLDSPATNRGLSQSQIQTLPQHTISRIDIDSLENGNTGAPCNICLGPYEPGEVVRNLPCLHKFHKQCIDHWLVSKGICPVCKAAVF